MSQAAVLGRQIAKLEMNIGFYREAACSTASSSNDEPRVSRSRSTEAPFTKMVHKVLELEEKVEKLLILRYLQDLEWGIVCAKLSIAKTTAMRWHRGALKDINIPE